MTKEIKLTQGQVAIVDDWWYDYLSQWKWYAHLSKSGFYARRTDRIEGKTKIFLMSRVVANTPDGMMCDHKNHNTLDNREENLRNVTPTQNQLNRRAAKNNKLGEKCIRPYKGGYFVQVRVNKKHVLAKSFKDLDEAKKARDEAVLRFHGDFATLK